MQIDPAADRVMIARAEARPARPGRAWMQLLSAVLGLAGKDAEFVSHAEKPWFSATFAGSRHTIALAFTGNEAVAGGETFIDEVADHEFTLARKLVADARVTQVDRTAVPQAQLAVTLEFLLLDED